MEPPSRLGALDRQLWQARQPGIDTMPRLYEDIAAWWPLISPPDEYAEEAGIYLHHLLAAADGTPRTALELGCGGGHNASHLKAHFDMTLVDLSPQMLAMSRKLNPECRHVEGDMRDVRLGRTFDCVFIHDAVDYMTTADDLRAALTTAWVHCQPGGGALFAPDHLRENFRPGTDCGGADGDDRSAHYLETCWDPDPSDTNITTDYAFLLRSADGSVEVIHDRHVTGLFSRAEWLRLLAEIGFEARAVPCEHSEIETGAYELLVCRRPG